MSADSTRSEIVWAMSIATAHANAFYDEVLAHGEVWAVRDEEGFPAPANGEGVRAMPFWSLQSRAQKIVDTVDAYADFTTELIPLDVWRTRWLPGLSRDGLQAGLNWSGKRATGYEVSPAEIEASLSARERIR
jgi:hypothetical protein